MDADDAADAGDAHPKNVRFSTRQRDAKEIRKSFAPYYGGRSAKVRRGAAALPGLAALCRPKGRVPTGAMCGL